MNKLVAWLALMLTTFSTLSQPTGVGATQSLDIEAERSRIQADRMRHEMHYEKEESACYARFAVTDCLREVRVRQRATQADLRRQELVIRDAERKRKTLEQMERIQEKTSAQGFEQETASGQSTREVQQEK